MFVPLSRLSRRGGVPGAAEALAALRRRIRRGATPARVSAAELEAAREVGRLRDDLAALVGEGSACGGCARGYPGREGAWDGGLCCSGATEDVFGEEEIDVLSLLGARPRDFVPPREGGAGGCLFRGPIGCSLSPARRPTICTHYICGDLMRELAGRDLARRAAELREQLAEAMKRYAVARAERRDAEDFRDAFAGRPLGGPERGR